MSAAESTLLKPTDISAVRGADEAHNELYGYVLRVSTGAGNKVMHYECQQCSQLGWLAGWRGQQVSR